MAHDDIVRRLQIRGRVQGVGYRGWMVEQARALGLRGWVRNRRDGSVEAVVAGPPAAVNRLVASAHRGPPLAAVSAVEVSSGSDDAFDPQAPFDQRPTS
jgi:acylphosphatase